MNFRVDIKDGFTQRRLEQAPLALLRYVDAGMHRAAEEVARETKREAPKAFSTLTQSIKADRVDFLQWMVAPHVDYAQMVVEGTAGGTLPPINHIKDWLKVKHIEPRDPSWTQYDLAWAIARKIAHRGTPANPFPQRVIESGLPKRRLRELVLRAIARYDAEQAGR